MEFRAITITKNTLVRFYYTLVLLCFMQMSHAADVVFVLSEDAHPYQQFVDSVKQTIENSDADGITSSVLLLDEYKNSSDAHKLVVAVGTKATRELVDIGNKQAIVSTLIPTPGFQETLKNSSSSTKRRISGIFINHSIKRNIAFYSTLEELGKQGEEIKRALYVRGGIT